MTRVFGEVASIYDDARAGYPAEICAAIVEFAGGRPPASVVEVGAGTGKATAMLLPFGVPYTAVEPDSRMAALLRAKFPAIEVVLNTFEEWAPTPTGLLACATAWHWLDPRTRNTRARDALVDGGVLAIFHHTYGYADPEQARAIADLLNEIDPDVPVRSDHWVLDEVTGSGVWAEAREQTWHKHPAYGKKQYLALTETFSPFRRHTPELRRRTLDRLGALVDEFGGEIVLDLRTTLVLAR